jgi:hypothetical protein
MIYYENVLNKHDNKNHLSTLADAAKTLTSCAEKIMETTENIIRLCDDKRMDYLSMPHIRTNELREFATLCNLAAKRLDSTARKLLEGNLRNDTLTEIMVYAIFLFEQNDGLSNRLIKF